MRARIAASLLLLAAARAPVIAQLDLLSGAVSQQSWTTRDGLPQNSVNALVQRDDGLLWVGTFGGLARFDGVDFQLVPERDRRSGAARVVSLCSDRHGTLWVGTEDEGLWCVADGMLQPVGRASELSRLCVRSIVEAADGALWMVAGTGIYRFVDGQLTRQEPAAGQAQVLPPVIDVDADGQVWYSATQGLYRAGDLAPIVPLDIAGAQATLLYRDAFGGHWFSTESSLLGDWPTDLRAGFEALVAESDERLWLGGRYGLAVATRRPEAPSASSLADAAGWRLEQAPFPVGSTSALLFGQDGALWVGTDGAGLMRFAAQPFRVWGASEGLDDTRVRTLLPDGADGMLVGAWEGLFALRAGRFRRLPPITARSLLRTRDGAIWVGADGRRLLHGQGDSFPSELELPAEVKALAETSEGDVWVGTASGACRIPAGTLRPQPAPEGLDGLDVAVILVGRGGELWFAGATGLARLASGKVTRYGPREGLPEAALRALHEDRRGSLWIGSYGGGLCRLRSGELHRITSADGLHDNVVSALLEDEQGRLWMNGNRGLSCVSLEALDALADGRTRHVDPLVLDALDGVPEGNGGSSPAACRSADGHLWFASIAGAVELAPASVGSHLPGRVAVTSLRASASGRAFHDGDVLPSGVGGLEVSFGCVHFDRPDRLRYLYRVSTADGRSQQPAGDAVDDLLPEAGWIDVGAQRLVRLGGLLPGEHLFEVAVVAPGGGASSPARLRFTVEPAFLESLHGRLLIAGALLAGGWFLHHQRLRAAQQRAGRLEREMSERIAMEAALRLSEERLEQAQEMARLGSFEMDLETGVGSWSRGLAHLLERPQPAAHCLQALIEALHQDDRPRVQALIDGQGADAPIDVRAQLPDGRLRVLSLRLAVRRGALGGGRVVGTCQDVTEQREIAAQIQRVQQLEAVGTLSAGVAHEFSNMLTSMLGHVDLARLSPDEPAVVGGALASIHRIARSASRVVRNLLMFSRRGQQRPEPIELVGFLSESLAMIRPSLGSRIELRTRLPAVPCWVEADAEGLQQVFVNLVVNARDAMPAGGTLEVHLGVLSPEQVRHVEGLCGAPAGAFQLDVEDEGVGIPSEIAERIFEPFFTTKARDQGTGLGLAVVQRVAAAHGWVVQHAPRAPRGTRFRIVLAAQAPVGVRSA